MVDVKVETLGNWKRVAELLLGVPHHFVEGVELAFPNPILLANERCSGGREIIDQDHALELGVGTFLGELLAQILPANSPPALSAPDNLSSIARGV